jgi:hypothetical protein
VFLAKFKGLTLLLSPPYPSVQATVQVQVQVKGVIGCCRIYREGVGVEDPCCEAEDSMRSE